MLLSDTLIRVLFGEIQKASWMDFAVGFALVLVNSALLYVLIKKIWPHMMDVTDHQHAEDRLRQSNADLSATLLAIPDLLFELTGTGEYVNIWARNPGLLAAQKERLLGYTVAERLPPDAAETVMSAIREATIQGTSYGKTIILDLPDGRHWFELSCSTKFQADEKRHHYIMLSRDVTERFKAQEHIKHIAYHDSLTGLPNRDQFLNRLSQALAVACRTRQYGAILFIDLDKFKMVNDIYGHNFGDKVLVSVADIFRQILREGDLVARFGGDEFVILLSELVHDKEKAASIALAVSEKLRAALEASNLIDEQAYCATASFGISLFPRQGKSVDDLMREADIAMYRAKERGRNTLVFFEDDMQASISERFALEQGLREALKMGGLRLFLQSKVDSSGTITGAEALVRWAHPELGTIMPATFISLAEETGLMAELGIQFSIDDFGTGYSSLMYLKRLPLDELKIDRSFVQDVPHDSEDMALVETILSIAHHLGFKVVAEGVETNEQFKFLVSSQCENFQGFFSIAHNQQRNG